ncbi:MAG: MotA/TolQ/ExbB proton channel family protein [Deltaproteobacteria bacterium]|nr:MotA/TolQ/ExbB proton channel family protein [Deltaproteobacteria bacterium]
MLEQAVVAVANFGATWILWLLLGLSIASIAVMLERFLFYTQRRIDVDALSLALGKKLLERDVEGARALFGDSDSLESHVIRAGLGELKRGEKASSEIMEGELLRQKARFESRLIFLGTLGNNAPFIGLLGTVLGIMKAFKDLSLSDPGKVGSSTSAVMAGISEALVATAVGLAVALPAVVAFNYFKSRVKRSTVGAEGLRRVVASFGDAFSEKQ